MRIVHLIEQLDLSVGGPVRAVIDITSALAARGHDVTVVTFSDKDAPEAWNNNDHAPKVHLAHSDKPGWWMNARELERLADVVRGADALHLHGMWILDATQAARVARACGVPYVISLRGMLDDWSMKQGRLKKLAYLALRGRAFLRNAGAIHTTAREELRQASRYFPERLGVVIPNYLDLDPYRQPPGPEQARAHFHPLRDAPPTALFLSRVHVKKGLEHLIDATEILAARPGLERLQVIVAGSGDDRYLDACKQRARDRGVGDRVHFVGQVRGDLKLSLYAAADCFVLPTSQENFGFVYFESLASGTPVVTTKGTDTWGELEASGGARITTQNPEDIADEAQRYLSDRAGAAEAGARGREWVFEHLGRETVLGAFEDLYRSVSQGSGS